MTAVLVGPRRTRITLVKALAAGADAGVHILTEYTGYVNPRERAGLWAEHLQDSTYDVIFLAAADGDSDAGEAAGTLAGFLDLPFISRARDVRREGRKLVAERFRGGMQETVESEMPCLVTTDAWPTGRIPSVREIVEAETKGILSPSASRSGGDAADHRSTTGHSTVLPVAGMSVRSMLLGEPERQATELVNRLLRDNRLIGIWE